MSAVVFFNFWKRCIYDGMTNNSKKNKKNTMHADSPAAVSIPGCLIVRRRLLCMSRHWGQHSEPAAGSLFLCCPAADLCQHGSKWNTQKTKPVKPWPQQRNCKHSEGVFNECGWLCCIRNSQGLSFIFAHFWALCKATVYLPLLPPFIVSPPVYDEQYWRAEAGGFHGHLASWSSSHS